MCLQALILLFAGLSTGSAFGPIIRWLVAGLLALIPLALAWGFYKNLAFVYNFYIFYSIFQIVTSDPFGNFRQIPLNLIIGVAIIGFVWYVRSKIFPDFGFFMGVKKSQGRYVFVENSEGHPTG